MDIIVEAFNLLSGEIVLECLIGISFTLHKTSRSVNFDNKNAFNISETAMGVSCGTQYDCEAEYPQAVLRWV